MWMWKIINQLSEVKLLVIPNVNETPNVTRGIKNKKTLKQFWVETANHLAENEVCGKNWLFDNPA